MKTFILVLFLSLVGSPVMNSREAIYAIIELEQGYVNDPRDPGGETKYGISKRSYPNEDIKNLTIERAHDIYKQDFWDKVRADDFPHPIGMLLTDFAIHSGPTRAVQVLQMVLKVTQDGVVGPRTIEAAKRSGEALKDLCANYLTARSFFLASLNKPYYIKGWTNRIFKLAFYCKF